MSTGFEPTAAPTLEDVARLAGVSRATASRAVRGGANVSPTARESVARASAELGYAPNHAARSLVTRRTDTIALVVPEPDETIFTDPFFGSVIAGTSAALRDVPVQMVLLLRQPGEGLERILRYLRSRLSDGVLLTSHHQGDRIAEELARLATPAVLIGRPIARSRLPFVDTDNRAGGRLATEHLIAAGCRRIAYVDGSADMPASVDRRAGFHAAMEAAELAPEAVLTGDFTERSGREAVHALGAGLDDLDGVFLASDLMAKGFVDELRTRGIRVPDSLRVIGYDDSRVARDTLPPLTTVTNPAGRMAEIATRLLLERIEEPGGAACAGDDGSVVLPPELVVRESA